MVYRINDMSARRVLDTPTNRRILSKYIPIDPNKPLPEICEGGKPYLESYDNVPSWEDTFRKQHSKVMEKKRYKNPQEAFDLMNKWTQIKTCYETQFLGKDVTSVDVMFKGDQQRFASVHYKTSTRTTGVDFIDLSSKILLDKPEEPTLDSKLLNQELYSIQGAQ